MARGFGLGGGSAMVGGNASPEDILINKVGFVDGKKTVGTMPDNTGFSGNITSVNQRITIPQGYHDGNNIIQINPDDQLRIIASNIRKDVVILGITGNMVEGVDTSDGTAVAGNILSGKTAYSKGSKITGTIPSVAAKTVTPSTSAQTAVAAGNYCSGNITVGAIPNQQNGGTWTPSTSAQTMVAANKYLKTAVTVNAIPNQSEGGAKYATTSAQTLVSAPKYITSNITLGALSQTNLAAANIIKGKTITINNGSSNVWSVAGTSDLYRLVSGTTTGSKYPTCKRFMITTDKEYNDARYATINPGITPVQCASAAWGQSGDYTYWCFVWRSAANTWNIRTGIGDHGGEYNSYINSDINSNYRFTSTAIDIPCIRAENATVYYWVWGY